jgi:ribose transport system ATP-binding protein
MDKILEMIDISKSFAGVKVLKKINFNLEQGEIRALLGANGAGKSTLMKILSGVYTKSSGEIRMDGKIVEITNPQAASAHGIGIIHQELGIIPTLTVLQNFYLGREITKMGLMDEKAMLMEFEHICNDFEFQISPHEKAKNLSVAKQQMIEIMKILSQDARIIVMDEPTTSLTNDEKKALFDIILRLKKKGKTIIYISHILEEVFLLSDRATIMRNGEIVDTFDTKELTIPLISEYMSGNKYVEGKKLKSYRKTDDTPILKVQNVSRGKSVNNISFDVLPGEVIGLAGLVGAGRSEIVRALFGADGKISGQVWVEGQEVKIKSPRDAIKHGIGLIPEDRKNEGLVQKLEIYKNATMVQLKKMKRKGLLNTDMEKKFTSEAVSKLSIKINSISDQVRKLSGGNQQKVVVSKWISDDFKVLFFDEPTKGIDIGAKEDIFHAVEVLAEKGKGIIFISSDLDEVLRVSDRVLVVRQGTVIESLENQNLTQKEVMNFILQYREQEA